MSLTRKVILAFAQNNLIQSVVNKYGMQFGAGRFVAGLNLKETAKKVRELNSQQLLVTLDYLGESVKTKEEAKKAKDIALETLKVIESESLDSNLSVKLTQLGLDIDKEFCFGNVLEIVSMAKKLNNFVRIDMEDSSRVDTTIEIFNRIIDSAGKDCVGLVFQSYLYRTEVDMLTQQDKNLRFVKGAYNESSQVAFSKKEEVDKNFIDLVKTHLINGGYAAIATHDQSIIEELKDWIQKENISKNRFEFQMLYGIRAALQRDLSHQGYKVRVYTPFGEDWYQYFTRRLAERPANLLFILKNLIKK